MKYITAMLLLLFFAHIHTQQPPLNNQVLHALNQLGQHLGQRLDQLGQRLNQQNQLQRNQLQQLMTSTLRNDFLGVAVTAGLLGVLIAASFLPAGEIRETFVASASAIGAAAMIGITIYRNRNQLLFDRVLDEFQEPETPRLALFRINLSRQLRKQHDYFARAA